MATLVYEDRSLREALRGIAGHGFSRVELSTEHLPPLRPAEDNAKLQILARRLGLAVHTVHLPFANNGVLNSSNELERKFGIESRLEILRYGASLGAMIAIVHPGEITGNKGTFSSESVSSLQYSLRAILTEAKKFGMNVAVENVPAFSTRLFGDCMNDLAALVEKINDPCLGLCLDTGHCVVNHHNVMSELAIAGDNLLNIHIQDNPGCYDRDPHLVPGQGVIDWQALVSFLNQTGYDGAFTFEVKGQQDPERVMKQCVAFLAEELRMKLM